MIQIMNRKHKMDAGVAVNRPPKLYPSTHVLLRYCKINRHLLFQMYSIAISYM